MLPNNMFQFVPLATLSDLCAHKLCHSAANVLPKCCSHFVIRSPAASTLTPPPAHPALSPTGRAGQLMNEHWPNSFTTRRSLSPNTNPNPNSNALFQFLPNACACGRPQIAAEREGKGVPGIEWCHSFQGCIGILIWWHLTPPAVALPAHS